MGEKSVICGFCLKNTSMRNIKLKELNLAEITSISQINILLNNFYELVVQLRESRVILVPILKSTTTQDFHLTTPSEEINVFHHSRILRSSFYLIV